MSTTEVVSSSNTNIGESNTNSRAKENHIAVKEIVPKIQKDHPQEKRFNVPSERVVSRSREGFSSPSYVSKYVNTVAINESWVNAMKNELNQYKWNATWNLVQRHDEVNAISKQDIASKMVVQVNTKVERSISVIIQCLNSH